MHDSFSERLFQDLIKAFQHKPTNGQSTVLGRISNFIARSGPGDTYLLKGYAGTGKTTIIGALVQILPKYKVKTVLLAPTGRAAKVMAGYSGKPAHTIHRKIYRPRLTDGPGFSFSLTPNKHTNTLFIVDEASMISDSTPNDLFGGAQNLLSDLIAFVNAGANCRMLLVGDLAQLPPIGQTLSPALDIRKLSGYYRLRAGHFELTEVVRQEKGSGILANATLLRQCLAANKTDFRFLTHFPDVEIISGIELGEKLTEAYHARGPEEVIVVTRSNRAANQYNRQIRFSGMWFEEEINAGDYLMSVKNNYFWLEEGSQAGFIANGDMVRIKRISGFEERYGFRFANLEVVMTDYPEQPAIELKVILDSLYTEAPALTRDQSLHLYREVAADHADLGGRSAINARVMTDPFYQALQIKFAYAVTCHKAQGGQWKEVFVDAGYLTEEMINVELIRWLYTAITRATEKLYLVNFPGRFLEEEN